MGKKYIIELEDEPVGKGLYRAKGFASLVFDQNGLNKLKEYKEQVKVGDKIRLSNGNVFTAFCVEDNVVEGFDSNMKWYCIGIANREFNVIGNNDDVAAFVQRWMR